MRVVLVLTATFMVFSTNLFAQTDFPTLDKQSYDYYLKGDYKNLKIIGDKMLSLNIDYYYLRMRLGILAYNNQRFYSAFKHFTKAMEFNSWDTISQDYIYNSYLLSGRKTDATLYLVSKKKEQKKYTTKPFDNIAISDIYAGFSFSGNNGTLYVPSIPNYFEVVKYGLSYNAGFVGNLSSRFKGTFAYTNLQKTGMQYNNTRPAGTNFDLIQNQLYAKLSGSVFSGWEFSGFGHFAFYTDVITQGPIGNRRSTKQMNYGYIGGIGVSKNGWRIRTGANISYSNFGNSNQLNGAGYITFLPLGNLNLYLTSSGMFQTDKNWGTTYQISQEVGFKVFMFLWVESGITKGNSFLYTRDDGYLMNNSFQIPVTTIYSTLIILLGEKFSIAVTPFYSQNQNYSWDLNTYTRTNKQYFDSFGGAIKLTFKNK